MTAGPLVEVEDLVVHFPVPGGVVHAVDGVSFDLMPGETVAMVGESGSGKTTTGFTVLRMHDPVSGRIRFDGQDITEVSGRDLRRLRREMQVVFQDPYSSLNPRMRVGELVAEPLLVHKIAERGAELDRRVVELLERCGLPADAARRFPTAFSGGQRQRVAIARALALSPKLIVADEAVSALDVSTQAQVINLMVDLREQAGLSYLFISHNLGVVRHIAHRIVILYAGRIMELGSNEAIFGNALNPYSQALLSACPVADPAVERTRERIVLRGEVPNVLSPPPGCRFNTRCPLAEGRCFEESPPLTERSPGHFSACWHR